MARSTPCVKNGQFQLQPGAATIDLETAAWPIWLEQHRLFRVEVNSVAFTARLEQRAGGRYWYAYRRHNGKLRVIYLGKAEELTQQRFSEVAQLFLLAATAQKQDERTTRQGKRVNRSQLLRSEVRLPTVLGTFCSALPTTNTDCIGRRCELETAQRLLTTARLLTLTGVGGVGKTRLALQIATTMEEHFSAVRFVTLSAIFDARQLISSLAVALQVPEVARNSLLSGICALLRQGRTLLVLDNCEHLVEDCARLCEFLLSACPALTLLTTSRELLNIPTEVTLALGPLAFPPFAPGYLLAEVEQLPAIQLFVTRAAAVQPDFSLNEHTLAALVRICQLLEGIPLAIELAAACLRLMSLAELATGLSKSEDAQLHLLTQGYRTAQTRHQTLRASLDWSYGLLPVREQVLLRRLSIFAGGWTLQAAEEVCADSDLLITDVLPLLGQLINKSLVQLQIDQQSQNTRYNFLTVIRQYATEQLSMPERVSLQEKHAKYFRCLAEESDRWLHSEQQMYWLQLLERERDNILLALSYASTLQAGTSFATFVAALCWFWILRSQFSEGRRWIDLALLQVTEQPVASYTTLLIHGALLMFFQGELVHSYELTATSLQHRSLLNERRELAWALSLKSELKRQQGDYQQAQLVGEECLACGTDADSAIPHLLASMTLATIAMQQNRNADGLVLIEKCAASMRKQGDCWGLAMSLLALGKLMGRQGDSARAIAYVQESKQLFQSIDAVHGVTQALHVLGVVYLQQQDYEGGKRYLEEIRARYEMIGDSDGLADILFDLGQLTSMQGDYEQARRYFVISEELDSFLGNLNKLSLVRYHLGRTAVLQQQYQQAFPLLQQSLLAFHTRGQTMFLALCLPTLAALALGISRGATYTARMGVHWLGTARALRPIAYPAIFPGQFALTEATEQGLRALLGEETFAQEIEMGLRMTMEQVLAEIEILGNILNRKGEEKPAKVIISELTLREREVLALLATGASNAEISARLHISTGTVRAHLGAIYSKLCVHTRTAAVHTARERGLFA